MNAERYCLPPGVSEFVRVERSANERTGDFHEVNQGLGESLARDSALRCLSTLECTFCDVCQMVCPDMCITRDPETGHINIDLEYCKGCGLCAHFCPKGAIKMESEPGD